MRRTDMSCQLGCDGQAVRILDTIRCRLMMSDGELWRRPGVACPFAGVHTPQRDPLPRPWERAMFSRSAS